MWFILRDLRGQKFGALSPVNPVGKDKYGNIKWLCECDCGNQVEIVAYNLITGHTKSCGCRIIKHGHASDVKGYSPTYRSWQRMQQRCNSANHANYYNYGGRGISICKRWRLFENFLEDMGERPDGKTLDRIDNDGNYCPENCRWATCKEQGNNVSTNVRLSFNGETHTRAEWSEITGIPQSTLKGRQLRGWSIERIITTPINHKFTSRRVADD